MAALNHSTTNTTTITTTTTTTTTTTSAAPSSLPFPLPKSPPKYPDMSGKRRELAKIQIVEREIGFLEEELKSVEGLYPASKSCKEVHDFVAERSDPLIPTNQKTSRSSRFWKWICKRSCFKWSWICCCFRGCSLNLKPWNCCSSCSCCSCACCKTENWKCFLLPCRSSCCCFNWCHCFNCCRCFNCCPKCNCFKSTCCHWQCCKCKAPSCPDCTNCCCCCRCSCSCSCPKCSKVSCCTCPSCTKLCCNPCVSCCYCC